MQPHVASLSNRTLGQAGGQGENYLGGVWGEGEWDGIVIMKVPPKPKKRKESK
jgi:hypothetical protein